MHSNSNPLPILIVGAGPTGLSLAAALTQLGIPIRIIESKSGISETSKATNLMQGTQEKLAIFSLIEPMLILSGKMSRMIMEGYDSALGARTMHLEESPYADVLLLGQDKIEQSLVQSLKTLGIEIEFNTWLIGLNQDKNRVLVQLKKEESQKIDLKTIDFEEELEIYTPEGGNHLESYFSYVIACDGPHGITRSFTSCNFSPIKTGKSIRQVDAQLKWKRLGSMKQMWLFYFSTGFMVVVPLLDGYYRILSIEPSENFPNRKPSLLEMENKLKEISGDQSLKLTNPKWFSHTELKMGIAPRLIDNRVILAGDAGNPILPNGGQGLNTGIQDSINLAWKLASVWKGEAKESLLETYHEERWSLRQALEKVQYNSLKYTTNPPRFMQWIISCFGNALLDKGEISMARAFSQLGVDYKKSSLSQKGKKFPLMAGNRILDADVRDSETGKDLSLFKELSMPVWKVLVFDSKRILDVKLFQTLKNLNIPELKTLIINASLHSNYNPLIDKDCKLFYDIDLLAHKIYGVKNPTIFLIRPDNHISLRTENLDAKELLNYGKVWFN